jgi:hypothetical protein
VAASALLLTGCPGMGPRDNERFQAVVARTVATGMPLATALSRLAKAGFKCDPRAAAPEITCGRDRQSLLPYVCIQRVNLATDPERTTVTAVTPKPIACAGL